MNSGEIKILPLGGLGEIGMNCMVLETQSTMIMVDCGLLFSDLEHLGVEYVIPDFSLLNKSLDKLKAIIITHGHEDHIGALPFAFKSGVSAPVYASPFSALLIAQKFKEHGLEKEIELREFNPGETLDLGDFKVKTESVNHSIVDAVALIIQTPIGKIIHTGDFKIDPTPFYGTELNLKAFAQAGEEGVLLLLSDSTNVERHEHSVSESIIYKRFEQLFAQSKGLTLVSMFASNISRMGQVFEIAKKLGKKVALCGRSMEQNVRLGMQVGYLQGAESILIDISEVSSYPRNQVLILSTGSQGEYRSALIRIASGTHSFVNLEPGDLVLMSSKFIPGNEKAIGRMINELFKQGANVVYESIQEIHVSGHATRPELKRMLETIKPRFFIPIHGEYRHLVHHSKVALETGIPTERILIAVNGDSILLTQNQCKVIHHQEESRVLVEGRDGKDVSKLVLKERRELGEKGVVLFLLIRDLKNQKILSGPEILAKGLTHEDREAWLIDEAKEKIELILEKYETQRQTRMPTEDLQESIRLELRRFFNHTLGFKPVVLPMVIDI